MKIYGYARVSSAEQNEQRQIIALKNAGVPKEKILIKYTLAEYEDAMKQQ